MLELIEEALDAVALGCNDDPGTVFSNPFGEMVGVVFFVGEGRSGLDAVGNSGRSPVKFSEQPCFGLLETELRHLRVGRRVCSA